jgi:hypothetical protein
MFNTNIHMRAKKQVLPGLEPGLQGSEPWVLTNYTIEPLVVVQGGIVPFWIGDKKKDMP